MTRLKSITIILVLAVGLLILAAAAKQASTLLQEGLYAEEVEGDLDAAIAIYEQIINEGTAGRSHIAQAMYRQGMCYLKKQQEQRARSVFMKLLADYGDQTSIVTKVKPLLDELANADPAALMPPDTLIYVELGNPGRQVETVLKMLKGTPLENPLAAIGGNGGASEGGMSPGDIVAGFLNPSMMAEFKKIRGAGIGITGIAQNDPPAIVVLFPGKSDALRGLIMAALVMLGKPVEAVEGMQCVAFADGGGAAYDDTTVILASPKAYEAGQLQWCVKQHKGVINEPTLASSNTSFVKVSKKDRQENALTIWANIDEVFTGLTELFPEGQMPDEILAADGLGDFRNIDDLIAFMSIQEDGIALEANVGFKDGHNCLAYNMIRTPKLNKDDFRVVPAEAVALLSIGLGGADSIQAQMLGEKIKNATGLEVGGDVFANIDQLTLFALPVDAASKDIRPGVPPIAGSLGLALSSPNPRQTRQILTGLLTAANLTAPQSGTEQILSLNPDVIEASASAVAGGKSVAVAGPLREALSKLSPTTNKLLLVNAGGAIRAGGVQLLMDLEDPEGDAA
ncbi:MAG: tetratricopeptide repeat protein, partial [Planctomycetota bacterium]